jgi:hypothetical protein
VFVDDSGRRRRAARAVGASVGVLALGYVLFVGLTLAGIPGLGEVGAPGLGSLTQPAGEQADVGPDPVEQAVPAEVAQPQSEAPASAPTTSEAVAQAGPTSAPESSTTTTSTTVPPVTTTTTAVHGNGPGAAVPGPNSTVPEKGGPPTSRPGGA